VIIYRYQEVLMYPPGATVPYDFSPATESWSLVFLEVQPADSFTECWRRHENPSEEIVFMEAQGNLATAHKRWHELHQQVQYLFGQRSEVLVFFTLLALNGTEIYLGGLVAWGPVTHFGEETGPAWWGTPFTPPVYPTAYDFLLR
jgi:hypothetical protein